MATLRKVPGTNADQGIYDVSGSLDGLAPCRRVVRRLSVRRLEPGTAEGLEPLARFPDLRVLEIEYASGVDLTPLAQLRLERLALRHLSGVDLAPLAAAPELRDLVLMFLRDCRVPDRLALPSSLEWLTIINDGPGQTGAPVRALIEAIEWPRLGGLRSLQLAVGGQDTPPAIETDLGFLRSLPRLEYLDVLQGIWHAGGDPSPLEPPFDGLARTLIRLRFDAWQPDAVKAAAEQYIGRAVSVYPRVAPEPGDRAWTISPPGDGIASWSTYGSLADAAEGRDGDTEHAALEAAIGRLRAVDPVLLERLDFDQESSGTGISAPARADLEAVLRLLGIDG